MDLTSKMMMSGVEVNENEEVRDNMVVSGAPPLHPHEEESAAADVLKMRESQKRKNEVSEEEGPGQKQSTSKRKIVVWMSDSSSYDSDSEPDNDQDTNSTSAVGTLGKEKKVVWIDSDTDNSTDDSMDDSTDDSDIYIVEKIIAERKVKGQLQYLVKWKGYPMEDNTWEPSKHLKCFDLIEEFKRNKQASKARKNSSTSARLSTTSKSIKKTDEGLPVPSTSTKEVPKPEEKSASNTTPAKCGLELGYTVDHIAGAAKPEPGRDMVFIVFFEGRQCAEVIPRETCNRLCPAAVIKFYEDSKSFFNVGE